MKLRRSCQEVTRLVLESEDRPLGFVERVSLRFHWMRCANCARFRGQAALMRQAARQWRHYRDNE